MPLVLFDIDGTILKTRGAGREALDSAFHRVCGWERATEGVDLAGNTDTRIVRQVVERRGATGVDLDAVRSAYLEALRERLAEPGRVAACPGVHALVDRLAGRAELGLLTGNWADGARIKLEAVGLDEVLTWGAFADDGFHRDELLPVARSRARARGVQDDPAVVIGDTPADVACARAGGGVAVVVETGFSTPEALARSRPDLQLRDLASGAPWILALVGVSGARSSPRR